MRIKTQGGFTAFLYFYESFNFIFRYVCEYVQVCTRDAVSAGLKEGPSSSGVGIAGCELPSMGAGN